MPESNFDDEAVATLLAIAVGREEFGLDPVNLKPGGKPIN